MGRHKKSDKLKYHRRRGKPLTESQIIENTEKIYGLLRGKKMMYITKKGESY